MLCMFVSLCVQLPSVELAVHYRLLRSSCDWKVPKIVSMFHVTQALLLHLACYYRSCFHDESITDD